MFAHKSFDLVEELSPVQLWSALFVVSILDVVTTLYGLQTGKVHEANPVVQTMVATYGVWIFIPFKLLALGIIYTGIQVVPYRWKLGTLLICTSCGGVAVLVNLAVLGRVMGLW